MNLKKYLPYLQSFFSLEGEDVIIDLTLRPLRVLCLKVTSLDADIRDVTDVTVKLKGCGKTILYF